MAINIQQALDYRFNPDAINQAKQMGWNDAQINAYKQQMYQDLSRQNAVQQAVDAKQAQAQQQPQDKGNWLSHLLPSGGSIAGGLGGAAAGAALGSVVPIVGTGIGALLGGILGGAGGGALGKVGENAVEGNSDLGQGVGQEALMGGLTSLPVGAALKVGQAGFKAATGIGKAGIGDVLAQAGEKTIPSQLAGKFGTQAADQTAGQAIANAGDTALQNNGSGVLDKLRMAVANKGSQMQARAGGYGIGEKVSGQSPLGFYDSAKIGQNLQAEGIKAGSPESRLKQVEDALNGRGQTIDSLVGQNNIVLAPEQRTQIANDFLKSVEQQPGVSDAVRKSAANLASNFTNQSSDIKSLIDFRRGLDSQVIAFNRNPDAKMAADQLAARTFRDTLSQHTNDLVPGINDANSSYHNLMQAKEFLTGGAKAVSDQSQSAGGGIIGRLLTNDTAQGVKSVAGGIMQKAAPDAAAQDAAKVGGQTIQGAIGRNLLERGLLGGGQAATDPSQTSEPTDANGLTATDYANAGISSSTDATGGNPTQAQSDPTNGFGVTPEQIQQAMVQAVQSGNTKQLANLTQLYGAMQSTAKSSQGKALSATQATQANNAVSGLSDLQAIKNTIQKDPGTIWKDALPGGSIARGLTGTTDYEAAKQNVVDVISRLRSGAAITADEAKRYMGLLPAPGDSQSSALNKINRLNQLLSGFANPQASAGGSDMASLLGQMSQ